jgi:hypothetical protein
MRFNESLQQSGIALTVVQKDSWCDNTLWVVRDPALTTYRLSQTFKASEHMDDCFTYQMPHILLSTFQEVVFCNFPIRLLCLMKRSSQQAKAGISSKGYCLTMLAKAPITSLPVVFDNRCSGSPLERWLLDML